jgi:hypothetical protein
LVAVLAASLPLGQYWSDSQFLVTNAASWKPYYNALYLPLGHGLWRLLAPFEVPLPQALTWLSALALGALAFLVALWPGRKAGALWLGPAAAALVVSSPAAWFHGTVIEVHLVGGLGAGVGWWLALKAHNAPRPRANLLLCLALLVTVASHLSQVLWLPGLVYLALGRSSASSAGTATPTAGSALNASQATSQAKPQSTTSIASQSASQGTSSAMPADASPARSPVVSQGASQGVSQVASQVAFKGTSQAAARAAPAAGSQVLELPRGAGLSRRGVWLVALLLLALTVAGVLMVQAGTAAWALRAEVVWLGTLFEFGRQWLEGLRTRGFYPPQEALGYLTSEWFAPQCLLLSALPLTLLAWGRLDADQRRLAWATLMACLLPMLVLSQGGILERGGYFAAALLPLGWLAAASSAALLKHWAAPLLLVLALGQGFLAEQGRREFRQHWEDPRAWAAAVAPALQPGDQVLVASLSQHFALQAAAPGVAVWDLGRELDMLPSRARPQALRSALAARLTSATGRVLIDRTLLNPEASGAPRAKLLSDQLADPRLQQPPPALESSSGRLLELRLKAAPMPGAAPAGPAR